MSLQKTVDKDSGGSEKAMYEQTVGKAVVQLEPQAGWMNWALQHPGFVVLGALVLAILTLGKSSTTGDTDTSNEDVQLFI